MKKIIVLTDFSSTARNAANAALNIATLLNCDLLLINSFFLPFAIFTAEAEGRSMVDTALIASASEDSLKKEARRLRRMINSKTELTQKPIINYLSTIESINQTIKELNETLQVSMLVMGVHRTSLPIIFSAIDIEPLLKQLKYPLLIIPKSYRNSPIKNFVFATDLGNDDIPVLRQIQEYSKKLKFDIHVCHVTKPVFIPDFIEEDKQAKFINRLAFLGHNNITFTDLKGKNVAKTLNEFNRTIGADTLGIIYNPHSFAYKLLIGSHTSQLVKHQRLPLIIFPANS